MSKINAVIALGYFDGVHKGHVKVLELAKSLAEELCCKPVVFTFSGNLRGKLKGGKEILSVAEKLNELKRHGFNEILSAPLTEDFLSLSPEDFLSYIGGLYSIKGLVCGEDYRFGKNAAGDVNYLKNYCEKQGIKLKVSKTVSVDGKKVSSSAVKKLLGLGDVEKANSLLGYDYYIDGKVSAGRAVGKTLGFPTVNLSVDDEKSPLKEGVYAGYTVIDGVKYKAIINYGAKPTFNIYDKSVEAYLIGFDGNLYGETITLRFTHFIREIQKFADENELKARLYSDKKFALEHVK